MKYTEVCKKIPSIHTSICFPVHVTPGSGYSFSDSFLIYLKTGLWQGERGDIKMQLMEIFFHFNSDFWSPQFVCLSDGQLRCLFNLPSPACSLCIWSTLLVMGCKWWRFSSNISFWCHTPPPLLKFIQFLLVHEDPLGLPQTTAWIHDSPSAIVQS